MKAPTTIGVQENLFQDDSEQQDDAKQKKKFDSVIFDVMEAMQAPIITCGPQWTDTIPQKVKDNVRLARIIALMKNEELATLEECVVYLSSCSLQAPMDYEWTKIYLHIGYKTMENELDEILWKEMEPPKELDEWLQSKLEWLRHELYAKRRKDFKKRLKETV